MPLTIWFLIGLLFNITGKAIIRHYTDWACLLLNKRQLEEFKRGIGALIWIVGWLIWIGVIIAALVRLWKYLP